ncbi:MAG: Cna B-type domain-containing protein, partial [Lachnospiraceae bacterium]|nr:Cna B-type domain-containing protein [Lachnospiraceae bacterium]
GDDAKTTTVTVQSGQSTAQELTVSMTNKEESKGSITLTKYGANSAVLAGAKFDLYLVVDGSDDTKVNTATLTTDADGQITVEDLEPGTYYFVETEAPSGYVTPTGDAAKTATVTVQSGQSTAQSLSVSMINTENGTLVLTGSKTYQNGTLTAGAFTFTVKEGTEKVSTGTVAADGTITFTEIKYADTDAVGTHTYKITEDLPADATAENDYTVNGIKYDPTEITVTVEVTDNGEGTLVAEIVEGESDEITFTNEKELTSITGTKTWADYNNADQTRPESITVNLLANGVEVDETTVTAADAWKYEFTNLPKYDDDDKLITYTVTEDAVDGYVTTIKATSAGYDITNTYTTTTSISGTKTWADNDNVSGKRPASITINLLANGELVDSQTVTAAEDGTWNYAFTGLDKYDADNQLITYTITEDAVAGYTSVVSGAAANADGTGYTSNVTNTLETGSLAVTKTVAGTTVDTAKEFTFTVTLSDTTLNGTFGGMTFANGVATFTLKHGETKTATGLPAGITYTVAEADYTTDGYVTASTGTTGTIAKDETQTAAFTNSITSVKIRKVDVTTGEELPGATIRIVDENGTVIDEWVSTTEDHEVTGLVPGKTYTLIETVAPTGYDITTNTTFTLASDGTVDTTKTTTTTQDGVLLVEDSMTVSETALISVTKNLALSSGDTLIASSATFYVGLYVDAACTNLYASKAIMITNASSGTVTFDNLQIGRTYYIAECDSTGTALASGIGTMADGTTYAANFGDGATTATAAVTDGSETVISFTNEFYTIPDGFYKEGTLTITKLLLDPSGDALESSEVFYAGIFSDSSYTTLADNVDQNIVTLDLAGGSSVSVDVKVSIETGETATLYVTEVDADGNPVADAADFAYEVSVDETKVTIDEDNTTAKVTITNQEIEIVEEESEEEEEETETEAEAVQTGDETPLAGYMALMLLALGVLMAEGIRRKKRMNR